VIGRLDKREKILLAACARETDIIACIERMAAAPIAPLHSGKLFKFICASLPIQDFTRTKPTSVNATQYSTLSSRLVIKLQEFKDRFKCVHSLSKGNDPSNVPFHLSHEFLPAQ